MDYDVVVIGAGIQGSGVAQAAAAAGYRVLLLEQYSQPATGTSSRSSKLIHGGLRYLETMQFSLVRESLAERAILLKIAPHLVSLKPFHIPIYNETSRRPYKVRLGLSLYSLFSLKRFSTVAEDDWGGLDGLKTENLQCVYKYLDAATNDRALTTSVLESAQSLGAEVLFNAKVKQAAVEKNGSRVSYEKDGVVTSITTTVLVNATGPWIASVAEKIQSEAKKPAVDLVAGTHIIVPGHPDKGMYYLEAQDDRAVFVLPWQGKTMIGTTETDYSGDPFKVQPLDHEVDYLLSVYNHYFSKSYSQSDVLDAFAGLRVLPEGDGSAFVRPRGVVLVADKPAKPSVISIYGGKLTVYRKTAEDVMKLAASSLPNATKKADTKTLKLP